MRIFFTVNRNALIAQVIGERGIITEQRVIENERALRDYLDQNNGMDVLYSSTVDFPHDFTDRREIWELCRLLRGNMCYAPRPEGG